MKQTVRCTAFILSMGFMACTGPNHPGSGVTVAQLSADKTTKNMKNLVSIVEIPTDSFQRAVAFYQSILGISIEEVDMQGTRMGILPGDEGAVNVVLVKGDDYKPADKGTLAYLNGGADLQQVLDKIEPSGGKVIVPKTEIDPQMGFFALFIDSEGNKMGLHSFK